MEKGAAARVFISYRRQDTAWPARQLYDVLVAELGADRVLKDVDNIEPGDDFVEQIQSAVGSCQVLLALIGPQWLTATDANGVRRLDDPEDFVRLEIETALSRDDVRVIPILVDDAKMPRPQELPKELAALTRRQAVEINPIDFDTRRLMRVLNDTLSDISAERERRMSPPAAERPPSPAYGPPHAESAPESADERPRWSAGGSRTRHRTGPRRATSHGNRRLSHEDRRLRTERARLDQMLIGRLDVLTSSIKSGLPGVDETISKVVAVGRLAFNPPDRMRQGRTERVEVLITRSDDFKEQLRELRGRGAVQIGPIETSPYMAVNLRGAGFQITSLTEPEQLLRPAARWEFDVVPRHSGIQKLQLSVVMRIPLPDRADEKISIPVVEREVRVTVDPLYGIRQFLLKNWQWLVPTLAGLGGAIAAWLKLFHGGE